VAKTRPMCREEGSNPRPAPGRREEPVPSARHIGLIQPGPNEDGSGQVCTPQVRPTEICLGKVRESQVGAFEVGSLQIGIHTVGSWVELCIPKHCTTQISPL
jgi:hypothetical protein